MTYVSLSRKMRQWQLDDQVKEIERLYDCANVSCCQIAVSKKPARQCTVHYSTGRNTKNPALINERVNK